jgi:hypothetical protein
MGATLTGRNVAARLYLYDDTMYAYYPAKQLPVVDDTVEPTFANGIRFEVGLGTAFTAACCLLHLKTSSTSVAKPALHLAPPSCGRPRAVLREHGSGFAVAAERAFSRTALVFGFRSGSIAFCRSAG